MTTKLNEWVHEEFGDEFEVKINHREMKFQVMKNMDIVGYVGLRYNNINDFKNEIRKIINRYNEKLEKMKKFMDLK